MDLLKNPSYYDDNQEDSDEDDEDYVPDKEEVENESEPEDENDDEGQSTEERPESSGARQLTEEERKKKSDELWNLIGTPSSSNNNSGSSGTNTHIIPKLKTLGSQNKRNLGDLVSNLKKKPKIGTLEMSKLDWDDFKKQEGLEDELKQATTRKDGYIEKQAFLSRADLRQFEIEKNIRDKMRKPPV